MSHFQLIYWLPLHFVLHFRNETGTYNYRKHYFSWDTGTATSPVRKLITSFIMT